MANYRLASYALFGLALVGSSCSQDLPVRGDGARPEGRIEFTAYMHNVHTRATEVSTSTLDAFQVSAFKVLEDSEDLYFENEQFLYDPSADRYISGKEGCRWPGSSDSLRFIAFSPSCDLMNEAGGRGELISGRIENLEVAQDIASQFDFVTAIGAGSLYYNEETGIDLTFQHQMSRIYVKAWSNSRSYDIEIAGVRIGGVGTSAASFDLSAPMGSQEADHGGEWESVNLGYVDYLFREGDRIVTLDGSDASSDDAVSILGAKVGVGTDDDNSAMVIPTANPKWDYIQNPANGDAHQEGKYLSVLLRVIDDTDLSKRENIVYPDPEDEESGETVYFAVDNEEGSAVKTRLFRNDGEYFTDKEHKQKYDLETNGAAVKAFAWAALPVEAEFKNGLKYTFTLNYTTGVGLRAPYDKNPGAQIISDKVLVEVNTTPWVREEESGVTVPRH